MFLSVGDAIDCLPIPGRSLRHEACDEVGRVEGDRNALAASHPLAFPLGRPCAQRGAAGPADGELVPVEHLVNGVSIVQCEAVERVAYFHVELDSHDVIVTDGRDLCRLRQPTDVLQRRRVRRSLSRRGAPRWPCARRASTTTRKSRRCGGGSPSAAASR